MKKILLSVFVILTFTVYAIYQKINSSEQENIVATNLPEQTTSLPVKQVTQTTGFKNGQYIGDVTDAYYGNIQVKAIITGGKITDVQFLQYPNDRSRSIAINTQAMPYLKQEAIQAQSANVDIVSGATQSSLAFRQSLQSALTQAQ